MKIRVKAPWMDGKGLHKIGDIAEVETAAFDPLRMEEIRGKAAVKEEVKLELAPAEPEQDEEPETVEEAPKPKKTTKKTTKKG